MKKKSVPIFPLDPDTDWDDLTNAMEASVQYQLAHGGEFGPLFAFEPMRAADDPDRWEPVVHPQNLLLVAIARKEDERLLMALAQARPALGAVVTAAPGSEIEYREDGLIAEVYTQMEAAGVVACCALQGTHEDDTTFICLRGSEAISALNKILGERRRR